jgi:twitching motility protein PilT
LSIAETGHLVFGTLHTNDTSQAVDRLIDVFPAEQQPQVKFQLSATLVGVVYQRLLPRVRGGRVAAHEIMVATHAVRNMIREGRSRQLRNTVATGQSEGMLTFEAAVSALVGQGLVTYEEAVAASLYPKEVMRARAS